jgi:hypothetical protein
MYFTTTDPSHKHILTLTNIKDTVTVDEVRNLMDNILLTNAIYCSRGELTGKASAYITETDTTKLEILL